MNKVAFDIEGVATVAGVICVYHVEPNTGEFIRVADEFLNVGVGIPAYSYIDEPLLPKAGFAVCRGESGWEYVEDHRGVEAYSTQTLDPVEITVLGPLPDDVTLLQPETPFDQWTGERWVTDEVAKLQAKVDAIEAEKKRLLLVANVEIATLSDAIEFGVATAEERQRYDKWRRYRVLLTRVDTAAVLVSWPLMPVA